MTNMPVKVLKMSNTMVYIIEIHLSGFVGGQVVCIIGVDTVDNSSIFVANYYFPFGIIGV